MRRKYAKEEENAEAEQINAVKEDQLEKGEQINAEEDIKYLKENNLKTTL
jgi:hypothetical protein